MSTIPTILLPALGLGGGGVAPVADFVMTWTTTTSPQTITLPATSASNNFDIDWGDTNSETVTAANPTHQFVTAGTHTITITGGGIMPTFGFNGGGDRLLADDVTQWGDVNTTNWAGGFHGCSNMVISATDAGNFSNVTTFLSMLRDCTSLLSLDISSWNTSSATAMNRMFQGCSNLATLIVAGLDTSSVTTFLSMFNGVPADVDVSSLSIVSLTNATSMFLNSGFTQTNYDLLLVAWEAQTELSSVTFHAGTAQYGAGAPATARGVLVTTSLWAITDSGQAP